MQDHNVVQIGYGEQDYQSLIGTELANAAMAIMQRGCRTNGDLLVLGAYLDAYPVKDIPESLVIPIDPELYAWVLQEASVKMAQLRERNPATAESYAKICGALSDVVNALNSLAELKETGASLSTMQMLATRA